jgi:steroid delta-isomerase
VTPPGIPELLARYVERVSANDVDGIVALYAPEAEIEIPVGGGVHRGIPAIRAYYAGNELAQKLEVAGPICAAGREGAATLRASIRRDGRMLELDVIDVVEVDDRGRIRRLRAFFDLAGAREIG